MTIAALLATAGAAMVIVLMSMMRRVGRCASGRMEARTIMYLFAAMLCVLISAGLFAGAIYLFLGL